MRKNYGAVGTKCASFKFADLNGDGKADIVAVDAKGHARAWLNEGIGKWKHTLAPNCWEEMVRGWKRNLTEAKHEDDSFLKPPPTP